MVTLDGVVFVARAQVIQQVRDEKAPLKIVYFPVEGENTTA